MTLEDVKEIILGGDAAAMGKMLDSVGVGLTEDGETYYSRSGLDCATDVLGLASAASYSNSLSGDLLEAIIYRTAAAVDIFCFTEFVVVAAGIRTDDFSLIPEDTQTALRRNHYTDEVGRAIEGLDGNAFAALLSFISKDVKKLSVKFNLPIIRRMHAAKEKVIPENLMLSYMAASLRKPEPSRPFTAVIDVSGRWPDGTMPVLLEMLSGGFPPF